MAPPSLFHGGDESGTLPHHSPTSSPSSTHDPHHHLPVSVALLQSVLPPGVEGACVLGGRQSGKSSLAFELCYKFAQCEPHRQAVFIHRHQDARAVAKTARFVVPASAASSTQQQQSPQQQWDFSVLENVFLKRFTTAQHLCWYFGSLHQQPDHLLPSIIVVDDFDQFRDDGYGQDALTVHCQVLSVMHDAAQHIRRRTGRPCWLVVTMEHAERGLLAPLTRQLGRVLRIVRQGFSSFVGTNMLETVMLLQEDKECTQLLGNALGNGSSSNSSKGCRYALDRPEVLQVLEEKDDDGN